MADFPHDNIKPFSEEGSKRAQVAEMFDHIAPRYDFMNRFLSAGIDQAWRKKAIKKFRRDKPKILLDVATGTADMAVMATRILRPEKIIGIDISEKMLDVGRRKIAKENLQPVIELRSGDGETIPFPDNSFDGVMVAFGVRNFENLEKGLREILRVLKPGAQLVVLEFSKPRIPGVKGLYNFYLGSVAPQLAKWFNQDKKAYEYLNESTRAFPDRQRFTDILFAAGFSACYYHALTLGICCIYSGRKPIHIPASNK